MNLEHQIEELRGQIQKIENKLSVSIPPGKELLTISETMAFLQISRTTLSRFINEGKVRSYRFSNRIYLKKSEIIEDLTQPGEA